MTLYAFDASGDSAQRDTVFLPIAGVGGASVYLPDLSLAPGRPNPASGWVSWSISRKATGTLNLRVFEVDGRCVRAWADRDLPAGTTQVLWDGRDDRGVRVPSGRYYLVVTDRRGNRQSRSETILR